MHRPSLVTVSLFVCDKRIGDECFEIWYSVEIKTDVKIYQVSEFLMKVNKSRPFSEPSVDLGGKFL